MKTIEKSEHQITVKKQLRQWGKELMHSFYLKEKELDIKINKRKLCYEYRFVLVLSKNCYLNNLNIHCLRINVY